MVKAAAIVQTAEQRTVCVCLFADKKTSFHTIDVTVIYSLVRSSRAVGRFKNLGGRGQVKTGYLKKSQK